MHRSPSVQFWKPGWLEALGKSVEVQRNMLSDDPHIQLKESWYKALATKNCREVKELLETGNWLLHEGWKADDQAWVQFKFQRGWKGRTALHVAARRGHVQLMDQILQLISCNETHEATGGDEGERSVSANCHLLKVVDGDYGLDALAMAVVNGNQAIVNLLKKASLQCELNPYEVSRDPYDAVSGKIMSQSSEGGSSLGQSRVYFSHDSKKGLVLDEHGEIMVEGTNQNWKSMLALSRITNEILKKSESFRQAIEELYYNDCDFNFLEISVYLFHFTFSTWKSTKRRERMIEPIRKGIFFAVKNRIDLVKYLFFKLKDGQGRTALHVAVDSGYQKVDIFLNVIPRASSGEGEDQDHEDLNYDYLNIADSAGRTPLYRAATKDSSRDSYSAVKRLLNDNRTNVTAEVTYHAHKWGADLDIDKLSWRNGFKSDSVYIPEKKLWSRGFNNKTNVLGGQGPFIEPLLEVSSTPLHVAMIHKHDLIVHQLLANDPRFSPAEWKKQEKYLQSDNDPSVPNSRDDQPSCSLILHPGGTNEERLHSDNDDDDDFESHPILRQRRKEDYLSCHRRFTWPVKDQDGYHFERSVSAMQLAVLVGNIPILQRLLKYQEEQKENHVISLSVKSQLVEDSLPSFQLAAAIGNPDIIKTFLDTPGRNPSIEDTSGNTALHYALKGKYVQFHPHLIDFVGCHHVFSWRWENDDRVSSWLADPQDRNPVTALPTKSKLKQEEDTIQTKANIKPEEVDHDKQSEIPTRYGQRRGAIKLLLQAGIDIWKQNNDHRTARPQPNAPEEFVTWWYEQVADETQRVQEKLNNAANAISVTAALVATASYMGPFQPPLGYDEDSLLVEFLAVRIFAVCDSLSFYFALIAITYSLLPSLPMPQESTFKELLKTRILVAISLLFLLPSIVCVLLAFAASYIAVIPDHGLAHNGLIFNTTVIGGFLCLAVMTRFLARLVNVLITLPKDGTNEITFIGEFFIRDEVLSIIKNWKRLYY